MERGERDGVEGGAVAEDLDVGGGWCPQRGVGGAEEEDAWNAARGGEVADAAVVAEEESAVCEPGDEGGERELVGGFAVSGEGGRGDGIGFAGDDEEFGAMGGGEPAAEFDPAGERPVFLRGAAAGMDGDHVGVGGGRGEGVVEGGGREAEGAKGFAVVGGGGGAGRERR